MRFQNAEYHHHHHHHHCGGGSSRWLPGVLQASVVILKMAGDGDTAGIYHGERFFGQRPFFSSKPSCYPYKDLDLIDRGEISIVSNQRHGTALYCCSYLDRIWQLQTISCLYSSSYKRQL